MLFDTHAHYDDPAFDADRDALLSSLPESGVELVLDPGCDVKSSRAAVSLAERYPFVYAAVGLHPEECGGCGEAKLLEIERLAGSPRVAAIGEIGLDYHWEENPPREVQQEIFRRQLALAERLDLPVIVHDRDAHGDSLAIVREFPRVRGVFHCYSGSAEMAQELLKRYESFLEYALPLYVKEGKSQLTIAVGCTGGKHRSITFARKIAEYCEKLGYKPGIQHRDSVR